MIKIGKVIYSLLTSSGSTVGEMVNNRIYPLIVPENTPMPCIIYERTFSNENNKDSYTSTSSIDVTILSSDYGEGLEIAESIDDTLIGFRGEIQGINVIDIKGLSGDETYVEDCFIQKLSYTIRAN